MLVNEGVVLNKTDMVFAPLEYKDFWRRQTCNRKDYMIKINNLNKNRRGTVKLRFKYSGNAKEGIILVNRQSRNSKVLVWI